LTPPVLPDGLHRIHLRITVEGTVHERLFEADPDLRHTFAWDRMNEYRQRVYGIVSAVVKVGYEFADCAHTLWTTQSAQLAGHETADNDLGGWELERRHRYNFHAGILQKGDGNTVYLKDKPRVVSTVMGAGGRQRPADCSQQQCNGKPADEQMLLAPTAVSASADGSVYVADYDLVRKIAPDGQADVVLKLK